MSEACTLASAVRLVHTHASQLKCRERFRLRIDEVGVFTHNVFVQERSYPIVLKTRDVYSRPRYIDLTITTRVSSQASGQLRVKAGMDSP